ncbi:MAG TPA: AAA family ATPase [Gemmatimonadales bacterium]|nr:AAA family ATPase [Gemmatimonadales bacterium]
MITCRTLGPLVFKVNGEAPPHTLTSKQQALLLYLAFAPRHSRSKDHLMSMFWPDAQNPAGALAEYKHVLKRDGQARIDEEGGQLRLDPSTVELDTTRFEHLVREQKWSEAAALIEGEFLEGFAARNTSGFDEWLEAERRRWRPKCGDVLIREAESLMDGGAQERAEAAAARALELMPLLDAAVRAYAKCLALLGRRTEALEALDQFVKRLKDVDGNPEPDTLRLIDAIKDRKAPPKPTPKPESRGPLVGRASQLRRVLGCWRACVAGEAGVAIVRGDPGMGKTRFADEVVERARSDGAVVAVVHAAPGDGARADTGLKTLVEGGLLKAPGIATAPPAAMRAIGEKSFLWAETYPVRVAGEPMPFLDAFTEAVRSAVAERPVLLVVDDAQEMDGQSFLGLMGVLRSLASTRLMLLVTASPAPVSEELNQLLKRVGRDIKGVAVTLEALTQTDLIALAKWALPKYDADQLDRIARRVRVESGGLPLIAYLILVAVRDGLDLPGLAKPWPPPKRTLYDILPVELPDSLQGAINVGFGRLTADAKTALRVLAVLGDPCTAERLAQGSDLPQTRLDQTLDDLEWQRWVVADARGYAYLARAIRDAVREKLVPKGEAQRIQARMIGT